MMTWCHFSSPLWRAITQALPTLPPVSPLPCSLSAYPVLVHLLVCIMCHLQQLLSHTIQKTTYRVLCLLYSLSLKPFRRSLIENSKISSVRAQDEDTKVSQFILWVLTNCESFLNKHKDLQLVAKKNAHNGFPITDRWCHKRVVVAEVTLSGCSSFQYYRQNLGKGCGVMHFVKNCWKHYSLLKDVLPYITNVVASQIWFRSVSLAICRVYGPPSQNHNDGLLEWISCLASLSGRLLFMGPFNAGNIDWMAGSCNSKTSLSCACL